MAPLALEARHGWWLALFACACNPERSTRYWLADRAAGAVVALDGELCVRARIPLAAPVFVCSDPGGLWVGTKERLVRVDRPEGAQSVSDFAQLVALGADAGGRAFVLDRGGTGSTDTLLWRVDRDQRRVLLGAFPAAGALAVQTGRLLVGLASGELAALRPDGAVLALGRVAAPVRAVAGGPRPGEWWVLSGTEGASLQLLDRDLVPQWSTLCPPGVLAFAPVAGEPRVWLADEGRVLCCGRDGTREFGPELGDGPWSAVLATPSGVLLLGPCALLELEVRHGGARVRRTQGGFAALAALARATQG